MKAVLILDLPPLEAFIRAGLLPPSAMRVRADDPLGNLFAQSRRLRLEEFDAVLGDWLPLLRQLDAQVTQRVAELRALTDDDGDGIGMPDSQPVK